MLNGLIGNLLAFGGTVNKQGVSLSLNNETLRLALGVLAALTGILKILSPVSGNIPVAGDLIPALAGLAGGFILVFEFYRGRTSINSPAAGRISEIIEKNRKLTGFVCIAVAALHFVFFPVLFL